MFRIAPTATAIGHQDGGQRAEDEEQDDDRAEAADHGLDQDVRRRRRRASSPPRAGRGPSPRPGCRPAAPARPLRERLRRRSCRERRRARRVDLLEGRVPVLRDVHQVVRREVRARPCARHGRGGTLHRGGDRARSSSRRRPRGRRRRPEAERRYRRSSACAGSPRRRTCRGSRSSGTSASDLARGEGAEERQDDPGDDDLPPVTRDDVCETSQHGSPSEVRHDWRLLVAPELIGRLAASVSAG